MTTQTSARQRDHQPGTLLARKPIQVVDGIPVFSRPTRYIETYETIARDHLAAIRPGVDNPWIPNELWRELEESTKSLIREFATDGQRILDVGVGLGRTLSAFTTLDRHGIDISLDYLKVARGAGIDAIFSRIEDMPYEDDSFDIVVTCDVLEHVFDFHRCCAQLVRVLKPGGILVVRVPNRENLAPYLSPEMPYETVHVRNFDESGLRLVFSRIFGCEFIKASPGAYYLQGPERLRLRLLSADNPLLRMLEDGRMRDDARFDLLKRASSVREQEVVHWLSELQSTDPETYAQVAPHLVWPLDINVVFRKPGRITGAGSGTDVSLASEQADDVGAQADVRRLSTLLSELRKAHAEERQGLIAEIERLNRVYGADRVSLVAEIGRLNTIYAEAQDEITRLGSAYAEDRQNLINEIGAYVGDRSNLVAEIGRLNTVHAEAQAQYAEGRQNLVTEIERLNKAYVDDRPKLLEEIKRLNTVYGEHQEKLMAEINRLTAINAEAQTEIERLSKAGGENSVNHRVSLEAEILRLNTVYAEAQAQIDRLNALHRDAWAEIGRLNGTYAEDRQNLVSEIERLNRVYAGDRSNLVAEIERLNTVYGEDRPKLVAEIDRLNALYAGAQAEIERLNKALP